MCVLIWYCPDAIAVLIQFRKYAVTELFGNRTGVRTFLPCLCLNFESETISDRIQVGSSFDQTRSCGHKKEHRLCNRVPAAANVPEVLPWANTREIFPVCTRGSFSQEERQHGPSTGVLYVLQIGTRSCVRECQQAVDFVIMIVHRMYRVVGGCKWPSCTAMGYSGSTSCYVSVISTFQITIFIFWCEIESNLLIHFLGQVTCSLIPRPSPAPVFDCLQFLRKLEPGKAWERG